MTNKKHTPVTAEELMDRLNSDPAFVARRQEKERLRLEREKTLRLAEAPVVKALKDVGLNVESCWDLLDTRSKYTDAIPVLLEHLNKEYPDAIKEGIVRALAIPEARAGRSTILDLFNKTSDSTHRSLKVALAVAIVATTTDSNIDEVMNLITDPSHGESRVMLLRALRKSKNMKAKEILEELRDDPTFQREISSWRKRK